MKIIIPGVPISQSRMRHCRRGNFITTYDPNAKDKANTRTFLKTCGPFPDIPYPRISFLFHMPIPTSFPKKLRTLYQADIIKHDKKPDCDNLIKFYLDCLDGIVFHGDQTISLGPCVKIYQPDPKTIIWIDETTQKLAPWELPQAFQAS